MGHLFGLFHTFENINKTNEEYKKYLQEQYELLFNEPKLSIYYDVPYQIIKTELNPFNTGYFPLNKNNEYINICNFMNYGEDDILTNFSIFQSKIMHIVINKYLFKYLLI